MSKTTAALFAILIIVLGILLFIKYKPKQNAIINSLTQTATPTVNPVNTTLSLTTNGRTVHAGQTMTMAVMIHSKNPQTDIAQFELTYDPLTVMIDSVTPGTYFLHPVVVLKNIDPIAGRITYALHCSSSKSATCISHAKSTLATITLTVNPRTTHRTTAFTFLHKSVVRIHNGKDILKKTSGLHLAITNPIYTISSLSAVSSQAANEISVTPTQ